MMTIPFKTKAYALAPDEGRSLQSLGASVKVKATSEQTSGIFNLLQVDCPPGFETPLHIHYAENVAVYVLEGALTVFWGSEKQEGLAGSWFFQPQGTPHGFRVKGAEPVRLLYLTLPAGFDRFVEENDPSEEGCSSENVAARYKIEILGQLPG